MFQPISHVQIEVWGLLTGGRALAKWHAHWRTPQHCHLYMCLCMIAVRSQPWHAIFNGMAHPKKNGISWNSGNFGVVKFRFLLLTLRTAIRFLVVRQVSSDKAKETEQQCQVKAEKETMECRLKLDLNWLNWLVVWIFFIFLNSWDDDPIWLIFLGGFETTN